MWDLLWCRAQAGGIPTNTRHCTDAVPTYRVIIWVRTFDIYYIVNLELWRSSRKPINSFRFILRIVLHVTCSNFWILTGISQKIRDAAKLLDTNSFRINRLRIDWEIPEIKRLLSFWTSHHRRTDYGWGIPPYWRVCVWRLNAGLTLYTLAPQWTASRTAYMRRRY